MTYVFNQALVAEMEQPPKPSLAQRLGISGKISFIHQHGFNILAEDNEAELVSIRFA